MVAGLSDGLDGYLAKRFNWTSELGKFLDPMADKLLMVTVFVEAAWMGLAPWWLTAAVVARDVLIALGALTIRLWFGPLRGHPIVSSKINTLMQLLYPVMMLANAALNFPPHEVLEALAVIVFVTTAISGVSYMAIFTRRALDQPLRCA
jgi:cardiolipin synthase